jgi:hypothetical protein
MSLSSRNCGAAARRLGTAGWIAMLSAAPAGAAEYYYQPIVTLSTAYNTNLDLSPTPTDRRKAEGYYADASTIFGVATPTSETILQPRLLYNYYPSASDRDRLEGFLNLNSRYSWQRDRFNITGFYDHRDDVNAEQPGAADTNTVNPGLGNTTPTTGHTAVGVKRDYLIVDPQFVHQITPLSGIGVAGEYQRLTYSQDDSSHLGFNFYQGKLFYSKTIDLRTDFSVGAYANRYSGTNIDETSNSGGLQANGGYNWTQTLRTALNVQYQETRFSERRPDTPNVDITSHPWAASVATTYDAQTSKYTFSFGRSIYPSSGGGLYTADQVRLQYDKDYTERLHFTGAVRAFRDKNTAGVPDINYRNYATGNLRVQYMLTPRLFVATSYTYIYQKYKFDPNSADANIINVTFGYRGIERQQR